MLPKASNDSRVVKPQTSAGMIKQM